MKKPIASIIVLTFNQLNKATQPCIESIIKNTDLRKNELIIVDNASTDKTPSFLKQLVEQSEDNIRIKLNSLNKGYGGGNNDGMKMARGQYIVLLNNDTLVPTGWLDRLLYLLKTNKNIGLVGPVTNSAGNEQRIELEGLNQQNFANIAAKYTNQNKGIWFETDKLGFFCVAMRIELVKKIGYLDENFGIGMFEDDDFCLRAKKEAWQTLAVTEDCFVYHMGSVSFNKLHYDDYHALFQKNKEYFLKKHGINWTFSDLALSYWDKFNHDLSAYIQQTEQLDPNIERVLVRFENFKHLLIQVHSAESKTIESKNKTISLLANKHQWQIRWKIFKQEFVLGSMNQKMNYLRAIKALIRKYPQAAEKPAEDYTPIINHIGEIRRKTQFTKAVIFPATIDYHYMKQRPQQLANAFADLGYLVIYSTLNYQADNVDVLEHIKPNLYLLNERWFTFLNHAITKEEAIFYCLWPNNSKHINQLSFSCLLYDFMDDLSLLDLPHNEVQQQHDNLLKQADLITVSSDKLYQQIPVTYLDKTLLINNAVEQSFIEAVQKSTVDKQLADDFSDKIVIGYFGAIAEWMDFDLIAYLANEFKNFEFIFVGPIFDVEDQVNLLSEYKNLHFQPAVSHERIVPILKRYDICIIPFLKNNITDAISPVKLFEYMSSGKPIITTNLLECTHYETVLISNDYQTFSKNIRKALELKDNSEFIKQQIEIASQNTWDNKVKQIEKHINEKLKQ